MIRDRLKFYEWDVKFLEALESSPFEALDLLHIRDRLQEDYDSLTPEERVILKECDKVLLDNAKIFYNHIGKVYSWENSQEPYDHWWWHLDKVCSGK